MQLKGDRVAFRYEEKDKETTKAGLIIPLDQKLVPDKPYVVTHIGDDVKTIQVGDKIYVKTFALTKFEADGEQYACCPEETVMMKVEE